jgi:hypothetical protein
MKNKSLYILFLFFFLLLNILTFCQNIKLDNSIIIGGFQTSVFYSNELNLLGVSSPKDSIENLVIKSTQGNLNNVDSGIANGFMSLTNLKNGKVTVSVYRKSEKGLQLLNYRIFNVTTKPLTIEEKEVLKLAIKPIINIEGLTTKKIPVEIIKSARKFGVNKPYKILSITIYVFGNGKGFCNQPIIWTLNSENFDENFKEICKRISSGTNIRLETIKISDLKRKVYTLNPVTFSIL